MLFVVDERVLKLCGKNSEQSIVQTLRLTLLGRGHITSNNFLRRPLDQESIIHHINPAIKNLEAVEG